MFEIIFPFIGGFGLFLFGMKFMSEGFQKFAKNRLKAILRTLSFNRFIGVLSGTFVTALVQSSSVTTVMVVGFVNAGLMELSQAISLILGANIGTTITAQIIAFKIQNFALPIIGIGALFQILSKRERVKYFGEILFGLGSLFFGMTLMGEAFDPLHGNETFKNFMIAFGNHPVLGVLAGMAVTSVVQSSSLTTGITIALAMDNLITFEQAVPLIIGENIGTTVTANLAAIGGSRIAKEAARAHIIVNTIGAFIILLILPWFMKLTLLLSPENDIARQIANSHTIFNVLLAIVCLPIIGLVAKLSSFLVFGKKEAQELYYLEEIALEVPPEAMDRVKRAVWEMHGLADRFLKENRSALFYKDERHFSKMNFLETKIERFQSRITEYIEKIAKQDLTEEVSRKIPAYVRVIHEVERISDYNEKISEVTAKMQSEGREFSETEREELKEFFKKTESLMKKTKRTLADGNRKLVEEIKAGYASINMLKDKLRDRNLERTTKTGVAISAFYFDVISALEEIAKKCRNIAATVL